MLTRLVVRNFQSIADADLELSALTVLVGPGRSGKSAILRAVRSALFNSGSDGFIRHGEKEAVVEMWFDDEEFRGETPHLVWRKERGKGGTYELNGKTFHKTGGAVPEEVAVLLGITEVQVGTDVKLSPQLRRQHASPFVIGETGSKQARILGVLTKLDAIVQAQMDCKKTGDSYKRKGAEYTQRVTDLQAEVDQLPDVAPLQELYDALVEGEQTIEQGRASIQRAQEIQVRQAELARRPSLDRLRAACTALQDALPSYAAAEVRVRNYQFAQDKLVRLKSEVRELQEQNSAAIYKYGQTIKTLGICEACPLV